MSDERQGTLHDVANAVDGLVVITRAGLRRAILSIIVCGVLLFASTIMGFVLLSHIAGQGATLAALTVKLESLAAEQAKMRVVAEKTQEKVDDAAQAAEDKPNIELRPATSSGKPQAVIVIKPPRPRPSPSTSTSASAPEPAAIELPVKLPDNAQVAKPADGGAEKK